MTTPPRTERIAARQADVLTSLLKEAQSWVQGGTPLDSGLSRFYHAHPEFGSRDRRLFSSTVFSYFRWKGWIDAVAPDPESACLFAHLLEATELHAALLTLAQRKAVPLDNLVPMGTVSVQEKGRAFTTLTGTACGLTQLVPDWILPLLGPHPEPLIEAFQTSPPTWIRTRPADRDAVGAALRDRGTEPLAHPFIASALAVSRGINLRALPRPIRDRLDIQDLASQITGLVCAPQPGESWWDACCGSGGKTLHLAELGGETVSLLATDIRASILEELNHRTATRTGYPIRTALWDGTRQPPPSGPFDGILLDAPCSGTGTWHRNPDARWRLTPDRLASLEQLQACLLNACASQLKPGGILVYATCSVLAAENEHQTARFITAFPNIQTARFTSPLDGAPCEGILRLTPATTACNGMFMARFRLNP